MASVRPTDPPFSDRVGGSSEEDALLRSAAILVVDDEPGIRNFLGRALAGRAALLELADSVESAELLRERYHFDLLILDVRLPGCSGLEWMRRLREQGARHDVIFITAYADLDTAIGALRSGASDFLLKPFRLEQLLTSVRRCLERRSVFRENFLLRRQVGAQQGDGIIGAHPKVQELRAILRRVAPAGSTLLLQGETGTGKELVAQAIHDLSARAGPFVAVNCGSISQDLLESELFGHTRGAFTGAVAAREGLFSFAHQGTLFLDEIGEMPLGMQTKLLRTLEARVVRPVGADREQPVDVRVIAASNQDLRAMVSQGRFREDLFYRLNVLTLTVPPLRERLEDIPALAEHFIALLSRQLGLPPVPLSHSDVVHLQAYSWPGNVRELKNVIERSLLLGRLPRDCCNETGPAAGPKVTAPEPPLDWTLEEVERQHMLRVLEDAGGNKSEAARRLGVSRKTMERKIRAWSSGQAGA